MSVDNFVQCRVVTPLSASSVQIVLLDAEAPYQLPPADGGTLVICDSVGRPSFLEVINYTSRNGLVLYGVSRGQEGTTALTWNGVTYTYQALTADQYEAQLLSKEPTIAAGTTAQYWRGDKGWRDFMADVRAASLTGLSTSTNAVITAADTVLSGLGKLQKQISDAATALAGNVRSTVLTGYVAGTNAALAATDTVLAAFGKIQGQLNAKAPLDSPALTGDPKAPTPAAGVNDTSIATTAYVQTELTNEQGTASPLMDGVAAVGVATKYAREDHVHPIDTSREPTIAVGTTAQYRRGDKTWADFFTDVRAATLTGLSTSTNAVITASDTVLSGLGKLQKQISDTLTNMGSYVRTTVLSSYAVGANAVLTTADTVVGAFGKVQGQLNAKANAADAALTGVPTAPTAAPGTNTLQVSNTAFVQQEIASLIAAAPGALNTLDELAAAMGDDANFATTVTNALAGKEPSIAAGTSAQFWLGNKTWADVGASVRAVVLTGLSVATGTAVAATDTVLVGIGKLQAQVTAAATNLAANVRATVLTGYVAGSNVALSATDTILAAFGKVQAQLDAKLNLTGGKLTGALNEATPVTLASATTVAIGAAAANSVTITGSVTIVAFDTIAAGATCKVTFAAALTLTHNAVSMQLPTGASILTSAGDTAEFVSLGGGNWDCLWYQRANGKAIGLGNVDNTSDANKPVSTAQQTALNLKVDTSAIVDNLSSSSAVVPLSAKQGKVLNDVLALSTKSEVMLPVSGVLDLSGFTGKVARVSLTANVSSITLPSGGAGMRKELIIEFTNTGDYTVTGWPTAPTLRVETRVPLPVGKGNGVVTQYPLSNTDNAGWLMHGVPSGYGLGQLKVPLGQRLVAGCTNGTALTTLAMVAARVQYIPFTVPRAMTLSAMGVSVTTAVVGTGTLGIYDSDGDALYDYPGTLLAASTTGAINTGTTGSKLASVDITLVPGRVYFAAFINSSAATVRAVALAAVQPNLGFTDNSTTAITMLTTVGSTNILPTSPGAPTTQVTAIPAIYLVEVL